MDFITNEEFLEIYQSKRCLCTNKSNSISIELCLGYQPSHSSVIKRYIYVIVNYPSKRAFVLWQTINERKSRWIAKCYLLVRNRIWKNFLCLKLLFCFSYITFYTSNIKKILHKELSFLKFLFLNSKLKPVINFLFNHLWGKYNIQILNKIKNFNFITAVFKILLLHYGLSGNQSP